MAIAELGTKPKKPTTPKTVTRVAYLVSRFPKLTETFVLYEILAIRQLGVEVELFPLRRERTKLMHSEAQAVVDSAHFTPLLFSLQLLVAHLYFICRKPVTYITTLSTLLRDNWGSRRYLAGAIVYFPKAVLLARRMQHLGVQHVHAHFASHPAAVAYVIHRLTAIPYSFTAHGSDLHCDRHMLRTKVTAASFVVAISNYNRQVIADECGSAHLAKIRIIHCGVDVSKFPERTGATTFEKGEGPFKLVCTGTLHEVKGQAYLIEACRLLKDQQLDCECHLIGDGPDCMMLQQLAKKLDLADKVIFHGRLPHDIVANHLQSADVLIAPSVPTSCGRREGIPVALMEAMSSGVPTVASDLSGIPELVIDDVTGLLSPPRDSSQLAAAIAKLYASPLLRRRLTQDARRKVETEFDMHVNALQLAECFQCGGQS